MKQTKTAVTHHDDRKRIAALVGIVAFVYLLTFSGARYGRISDGKEMFATALSMYEFHGLAIPDTSGTKNPQAQPEIYSKYGIGFPLVLQVPLFLANQFQSWFGWKGGDYLFPLTNLLLNVLTSLLIALIARRLRLGWWAAYCAAIGFGLGSFAWPYISFDFSEPLQAFCLALAFWALVAAIQDESRRSRYLLLSGFALGFALLTKTVLAAAVPAYLVYLWMQSGSGFKEKVRHQLLFLSPIACAGVAVAAFNFARYGSALNTGYGGASLFSTPLWIGLYGLLLSPNKGLPVYAPLVLLLPLAAVVLWKQRRGDFAFLGLLCGALIVVSAKWWSWEGGSSWGPRLLYPLLPFLMLWSASVADRWKAARVPAALLIALGVAINLTGVLFYFSTWGNICGSNGDLVALDVQGRLKHEYQVKDGRRALAPFIAMNYVPSLSPVLGHAWMLRWRYFGVPFPMASLLGNVPVASQPYGPVTINFGQLGTWTKRIPAFFRELTTAELAISGSAGANPIRSKTYAENGDRFAAKRDFATAYYAYRKAYDLGYDTPRLLPKLGATCYSLGRIAEAEAYFDQYLADFPNDRNVRTFYAQALEATRQQAKSQLQYQLLQKSPK